MNETFCRFFDFTITSAHSSRRLILIRIQGKTEFFSVQYKNGCLCVSDFFDMFTQSIKFYYHVLKGTDV